MKALKIKEDEWEAGGVREAFIGGVREAFVVMAAASYPDLQTMLFATNDCGLRMGVNEGCDYNQWL